MVSLTDVAREVVQLKFSTLCYQNNLYSSALMKNANLQVKTVITVNCCVKMKVDVV